MTNLHYEVSHMIDMPAAFAGGDRVDEANLLEALVGDTDRNLPPVAERVRC
jgi:hypothetical protein